MSNTVFITLAFLIISGIVIYKSNEEPSFKAPIVKKYKKNKRLTPVVTAVEKKESPAATSETLAPATQSPSVQQNTITTPQETLPASPTLVTKNEPVLVNVSEAEANDTLIEVRTNLSNEEKANEIYKIAGLYRLQLEEIYKDRKLFYNGGPKITTLLSDTHEYITEREDYVKEADPAHIKELDEFIETVYKMRDEGNQRVLQRRK